jgi:V8-like Glu-specific endopeptidase
MLSILNHAWREFDVCIPYAAIAANKRHIQKRHEKFIVARGSRDSDIWSGTWSNGSQMSESNHAWREFDVCIPYAAIAANKRHIQKRHEKFIVARGSRDSDIWSGTWSNGSQMSESNHAWRECDVCIPYAAISANKRQIQKRHANFIVARGSRDSDIWSGTWRNGSQMSESNHARVDDGYHENGLS